MCDLREQVCVAVAVLRVEVTPANPTVVRTTAQRFTAIATYNDGATADVTAKVTWTSSAVSVATLDATGLVTGVSSGQSTISASFDGTTGSTLLTVSDATLASLTVTPTNPAIASGTKQVFTATGNFSDGSTQDVTEQATWSSSATNVASVDASGVASGSAAGSTTIAATLNGVSGTTGLSVSAATLVSITVDPALPTIASGLTQQFTAIGTFSDTSTQDVTTQVAWASSDSAVATVSNAAGSEGLAQTIVAGSTAISATLGSVTGSATVSVSNAAVVSITIDPLDPSIAAGTQQQFTATGVFTDGRSLDVTTQVAWASSATNVAAISNASGSQGLAQSVAVGSTTISASMNNVSDTSTLTVTSATLQSISIDPINSAIAQGVTQPFIATGKFSDGSTANLTTQVAWSSSNLTVASISNASGSEGLASSIGVGSTTIGALLLGVTGQTQLTINASSLVSISVSPVNPSIAVTTQQPFTASGTFDNGSTQDITSLVNWASSNMQVATVSNVPASTGVATGLRAGQSTISASFRGKTGQTTLTVAAIVLQAITIAPSNASIGKTRQQFTATGTFSDGSMRDVTKQVTWSSSARKVAVISNALRSRGLATGRAQGTTTIGATLNGVSASTTLTVNTATLTSIAVSPATASIARQQTKQFTAVGTFSDSSTQDLTAQVTWSSSSNRVATISKKPGSRGQATGVAAGSTTIEATLGMISGTATLTVTR